MISIQGAVLAWGPAPLPMGYCHDSEWVGFVSLNARARAALQIYRGVGHDAERANDPKPTLMGQGTVVPST